MEHDVPLFERMVADAYKREGRELRQAGVLYHGMGIVDFEQCSRMARGLVQLEDRFDATFAQTLKRLRIRPKPELEICPGCGSPDCPGAMKSATSGDFLSHVLSTLKKLLGGTL